jgi:hypothetical protein
MPLQCLISEELYVLVKIAASARNENKTLKAELGRMSLIALIQRTSKCISCDANRS